jgi:DNA-directed RNA polymerase II subunit RPB1
MEKIKTLNSTNYIDKINDANLRLNSVPRCDIVGVDFSYYTDSERSNISVVTFPQKANLGKNTSIESPYMGTLDDTVTCSTCSKPNCPQHFGNLKFDGVDVYNPTTIEYCVMIMKVMCFNCGNILNGEYNEYSFPELSGIKKLAHLAKLNTDKHSICICTNQRVYKTYKLKKKREKKEGKIIGIKADGREDSIPPNDFRKFFIDHLTLDDKEGKSLSDAKRRLRIMGFHPNFNANCLVMSSILIPPICVRPEFVYDGTKKSNNLTTSLLAINIKVINSKEKELSIKQSSIFNSIYNTIYGAQEAGKKTVYEGIIKMVQGKRALIRECLSSKRNDEILRTVAGGAPHLKYGEVALPFEAMNKLTKAEKVTRININELQKLLKKGKVHSIVLNNGCKKLCNVKINQTHKFQIGEIAKRYLKNGDTVCVNRQPTLHKQSMSCYQVVGWPHKTIGLHLSDTTKKNADFDGDEISAWNTQTPEVEAETQILMGAKNNIMSTETNRPVVGIVMNGLTGAYLLSDPSLQIDEELYDVLVDLIEKVDPEFDARLKKYRIKKYTGRGVLSLLFPEDFFYNYEGVLIMNGILISGRLKKKHLGTSSRSIIQELWKKYNPQIVGDFITYASWLINRWLIDNPLSISIADCYKDDDSISNIINSAFDKLKKELDDLGGKKSDDIEEDYRQKKITEFTGLNTVIGARISKEVFDQNNAIGIITEDGAGTKGTKLNVCQIVACVGQQFYRGKRLVQHLAGGRRVLPFFDFDDNSPEANGFVYNSFFKGLRMYELFFIQSAGREGIVDTALETADSGYLQRNMIKSQEGTIVEYGTKEVKNTFGFKFSGLYPYSIAELLTVKKGNNSLSLPFDIKKATEEINVKYGWCDKSIYDKMGGIDNTDINVSYYREKETIFNPQRLNRFEKSRIISSRAAQIANDDDPLVNIHSTNPVVIANEEYNNGLLTNMFALRKSQNKTEKIYCTPENIF